MKNKFLLLSLLLGSSSLMANAQNNSSTMNSTGGSKTISGNVYEYSIGEMTLVNTASSSNLIVTQGLLQPIISETSISDDNFTLNNLSVYPSPFEDIVSIDAQMTTPGKLSIMLIDMGGKELFKKEWQLTTGKEINKFDLSSLASGTYLLQANYTYGNKTATKSFKIQKVK